jgi:CxxC-x17-CxxC domain-containing protein
MGNFNRSNRRSGGGSDRRFGGNRRDGGRDGGRPTMHRTTCGDCGESCEVPFKPTGDKPVYCSDCFGSQGGGNRDGGGNRGGRSGGFDRRNKNDRHRNIDREMYDVVCSKCGNDCQVPFKPQNDKPLFCNDCFGESKGSRKSGGGCSDVAEQIKILNNKIDKLTEMLSPKSSKKKEDKKEDEKKPTAVKKVAKKTEKKKVKKTITAKKEKATKKKK